KLPGSGGGADIAIMAKRWVTLMSHERRRLVERVAYVTSPGHGDGAGWRGREGRLGGGPAGSVANLAGVRFPGGGGGGRRGSVQPGVAVEDVMQRTGWQLQVADRVVATPEPTPEELAQMRRLDPDGFWTRRG